MGSRDAKIVMFISLALFMGLLAIPSLLPGCARTPGTDRPITQTFGADGMMIETQEYVIAYQHLNITSNDEEQKKTLILTTHGNMIVDGYWNFDYSVRHSFGKYKGEWTVALLPFQEGD